MTDEPLAEIVPLFPDADLADDDAPLRTVPKEKFCLHRRVALDPEAHKITCRDCEREVDPFAYLLDLTRSWENFVRHRKEAQRRAAAAKTRLNEILRLERNARTRLKKLDPTARPPERPWGDRSL